MNETLFTRRNFLRGVAAAGLVTVSATAAYAELVEPHRYELTETDVFIRGLPESFDGFRITQVSDVHHSTLVSIEDVRRVVKLAQSTKPDAFVLTGDYSTARRRFIEPCAEALAQLSAPEGVWAVLGNHDQNTDPQLTIRALERAHINVIENRNTRLRRGGDELQLAGVGDWSWAADDWTRALAGINQKQPTILLSHQPHALDLPQAANLSLILSGHTHGGQISLPFIGSPVQLAYRFRYLSGLYQRGGGAQLYVSRGTGMIGVPFRIGAPPEIAVLRLRRAKES
ncbi:MAG: metallophosphoesterase [Pyrinomonadaceae bacterium]